MDQALGRENHTVCFLLCLLEPLVKRIGLSPIPKAPCKAGREKVLSFVLCLFFSIIDIIKKNKLYNNTFLLLLPFDRFKKRKERKLKKEKKSHTVYAYGYVYTYIYVDIVGLYIHTLYMYI